MTVDTSKTEAEEKVVTPAPDGDVDMDSIAQELAAMREGEGKEEESKPAPAETVAKDPEPEQPPPKKAEDDLDAERLAAIHRAKKREEEAILREKAELRKEREAFQAEKAKAKQVDEIIRMAAMDPARFYQEVVGIKKTGDIGKLLFVPEFGDNPPEELKGAKEKWQIEQRFQEMQTRLAAYEQREQERQRQEQIRTVRDQVAAEARSALKGDDLPILKAYFESDPNEATEEFFSFAMQVAERSQAEGYDEPPPIAEIAKAFEERQRRQLAKFGVNVQKTAANPGESKTGAKTLTNQLVTTTNKKPLPETDDELLEDVLEGMKRGEHLRVV